MPKGKRKPQAGTRLPSVRGVVVVDEWLGQPRTRAWPQPRGPNRHPTNRFWSDWLAGVTFLYRYQPARFRALMDRATKNTPWMPRDPFISGARGRAWSFTDQDGRTYYPMPAKNAVSQSLDALAEAPGALLYRAATLWRGIAPPAAAGLVLTSNGPEAEPSWQAGGGGGGGTIETIAQVGYYQQSGTTTASRDTFGAVWYQSKRVTVEELRFISTGWASGRTFRAYVLTLSGSTVTDVNGTADALGDGSTELIVPFATPPTIEAGDRVALMIHDTTGANIPMRYSSSQPQGSPLPMQSVQGLLVGPPAVGSSIALGNPGGFATFARMRWTT